MPDPFAIIKPLPVAHAWLRLGEVKPTGWMREQMLRDLEHGFVGHLDALVPALIQHDGIYGPDRLTRESKHKDLGTIATDAAEQQVQYAWWNSETQSNWWDGFVRSALLLDHAASIAKARAYVERMLSYQDLDGYLGVYAPDLRYCFTGENGELWAQATLFRALLGYYEATGETRVLEAVERAAKVTMAAYPAHASQPFPAETSSVCGDSHGLALTDALERLGELTRNPEYAAYASWLYEAYSGSRVSQDDAQYDHLVDPACRFRGHGVHTYEHLRSLLVAVYATGNPRLGCALQGYLAKLESCLAPSGGPIGDEFIEGRTADASETGYEYCSIHELLHSYTHLLQKSGAAEWGDRAEWLLFNAGQGARHPDGRGITYLRTDNSTALTGPLHPGDPPTRQGPQTRYKFSPAHQDVAVCCVPNAGRIYPYYVGAMWMRSREGLVAALYGPCELRTTVRGTPVRIVEETDYPFDLQIAFTVEVGQPVEFELALRLPGWAIGLTLSGADNEADDGGFIRIRRTWAGGERFTLQFEANVKSHPWGAGEAFVSYGPLLFALPLGAKEEPGREYSAGFRDYYYHPVDGGASPSFKLAPGASFTLRRINPTPAHPWESLALDAEVLAGGDGAARQAVRLVPFGGTILRRVTFDAA